MSAIDFIILVIAVGAGIMLLTIPINAAIMFTYEKYLSIRQNRKERNGKRL